MEVFRMKPPISPNPGAGVLSSVRSISCDSRSLRFPLLHSLQFPASTTTTIIRMGGGPRTYPGGVSKWQWKRMQQKKAKQLLKARLCRERQIYDMRKRAELKEAVGELEKPWEDVGHQRRSRFLFSLTADEQVKTLADRFQKPGGYDLWSPNDGPRVFHAPDGLPSARFFPKGAVHSIQPYTKVTSSLPDLDDRMSSLDMSDQENECFNSDSRSRRRTKSFPSGSRVLPNGRSSTDSTTFHPRRDYDSEWEGEEFSNDGYADEEEDKVVEFVRNTRPVTRTLRGNATKTRSVTCSDSDFRVREEFIGAELGNNAMAETNFPSRGWSEFNSDADAREEFVVGKEEEEQRVGLPRSTNRPDVKRRNGLSGQSKVDVHRRPGSSGRFMRRSKVEREYEEVYGDRGRRQIGGKTTTTTTTPAKPGNRSYR